MFQCSYRAGFVLALSMLTGFAAEDPDIVSAGGAGQRDVSAALRIVVVEGEDAVNIIGQKTAVAPVVEVRDRNDQPVAGAVVRFAIRSGRASFGGARTVTITTNAAGRAAAAGFTPTGSGAVQITASAAFQGQTAVATIAQTNVLTAAQASTATASGAGSGAGGSTAGTAGGAAGGGGLSTTTLAVIGGAAVGGAVAATQILGGDGGGDDVTHYSGPFSGNSTAVAANGICSVTSMHVGTVSLDIKIGSDGAVTGTGEVNQTRTVAQSSCGAFPVGSSQSDGCCQPSPAVSGTTASLSFSGSHPGGAGTVWQYDFSGSLNSGVVTGTFVLNVAGDPAFQPVRAVFPVVLQ